MPIRLPQGNISVSDVICRRLAFIDGTEQTTAANGTGPITPSRITLPQVNEPLTPTLAFGDGDTGFFEGVDDLLRVSVGGIAFWDYNNNGFFLSPTVGGGALKSSGASATVPTLIPDRSDLNTGIGTDAPDQLSLIAGGVQVANLTEAAGVVQFIVPLQNNAAAPSIAFGDGDTGFYEGTTDDVLNVSVAGISQFIWTANVFEGQATNSPVMKNATASATNPVFAFRGDTDTGIGRVTDDQLALIAGGLRCMSVSEVGGVRRIGFYEGSPVALQTGVPVTTSAIHAALVNLRLITA